VHPPRTPADVVSRLSHQDPPTGFTVVVTAPIETVAIHPSTPTATVETDLPGPGARWMNAARLDVDRVDEYPGPVMVIDG